jgi:hypothetical protein
MIGQPPGRQPWSTSLSLKPGSGRGCLSEHCKVPARPSCGGARRALRKVGVEKAEYGTGRVMFGFSPRCHRSRLRCWKVPGSGGQDEIRKQMAPRAGG